MDGWQGPGESSGFVFLSAAEGVWEAAAADFTLHST